MMSVLRGLTCAVVFTLPMAALASDKNKGTEYGCDLVNWGPAAVAALPRIGEACHRIKIMDDKVYAEFVGTLESRGSDTVTVRFEDRSGKPVSEMTLKPAPGESVYKGDNKVKFSDVKKGEKLNFWLEHSKWSLYGDPESPAITVVDRKAL